MTQLQYIIGVALVLIVTCAKTSNGIIKCFQCNSNVDKECGYDNITLYPQLQNECSTGKPPGAEDGVQYKLCRKIKQVIDFEVNGLQPESRIIRTCGWDDSSYKNKCYQRSGFGGRQEVCACDQDGCNNTSITYASVSLLIGLLTILKLAH